MRGRRRLLPAIALLLCLILSACQSGKTGGTVTIASKQFTENILLSEMYAQLIESHTELKVVRMQDMGTTAVCFTAMENGEVDIYVEYTGTVCTEILRHEQGAYLSPGESYELVKGELKERFGITAYPPIGLNNNYAAGMMRAKAESLGVASMSDLSGVAEGLVFTANDLFFTRLGDGYAAMTEKYDMGFKSVVKMSNEAAYDALENDFVDVMIIYTTDSLIQNHDMIILDDDRNVFPDCHALPIIRDDVLKKYPELDGILGLLTDSIDNERMQELNYSIDIGGQTPSEVAETFLTELGLLKK